MYRAVGKINLVMVLMCFEDEKHCPTSGGNCSPQALSPLCFDSLAWTGSWLWGCPAAAAPGATPGASGVPSLNTKYIAGDYLHVC